MIDAELLQDPYKDVPDEEKSRLNADFATRDKTFIQALCPHRGVLQAMVNLYIKAVVEECKEKGITSYDRLQEFIDIVRRRTSRCPDRSEPIRNERRRTASVRKRVKKPADSKPKSKGKARTRVDRKEKEKEVGAES